MLKNTLSIILSIGILFGVLCSCGGSSGSDEGNETSLGIAPTITNFELYKIVQGNWLETSSFQIGDEGNVKVYVTDPDKDIDSIECYQFLLPDLDNPYYDSSIIAIDTQKESVVISFKTRITIKGPVGDWTFACHAVDSKGNKSDTFSIDCVFHNDQQLSNIELLIGTWRFTYFDDGKLFHRYYNLSLISTDTNDQGGYFIHGVDEEGEFVVAMYSPDDGYYSLSDQDDGFRRHFKFYTNGVSIFNGSMYYRYNDGEIGIAEMAQLVGYKTD